MNLDGGGVSVKESMIMENVREAELMTHWMLKCGRGMSQADLMVASMDLWGMPFSEMGTQEKIFQEGR